MDRDTLLLVDSAQQPVDRQREIRKLKGVVQVVERRMEEPLRVLGGRDATECQQMRDHRVDVQCGHQGRCALLVIGQIFPDQGACRGVRIHCPGRPWSEPAAFDWGCIPAGCGLLQPVNANQAELTELVVSPLQP